MADTTIDIEPVEDFRRRLRAWLPDNMPRAARGSNGAAMERRGRASDEEELAEVAHARELQRKLFDGGFAGIIFPKEYGGAGLTPAHQQVFNEEIYPYEFPRTQVPNFQPCATVINEFGTHEQKLRQLPPIFKGETLWMQMLSEPSGGSDVAGAQTTAIRDGEEWVLNGSKIWTTGAWWSDWALCLARTNWDVQKHRGLTVFMVRFDYPGMEVHRIEMLNGSKEFCQEFLTDVRINDRDRIGEVDQGWTVGTRWMFYEKSFGVSYFVTRPTPPTGVGGSDQGVAGSGQSHIKAARAQGRLDDPITRELIGEAHALSLVSAEANRRIGRSILTGKMSDQGAGLSKILGGTVGIRQATLDFQLAGQSAGAWTDENTMLGERGISFLTRQAAMIGGGTVEMSRNVVSERLLGMPRERTLDRDVAFREVPKSPSPR
jgi:alkylation response protein AidB-like acyl-CoA dehydrogenase